MLFSTHVPQATQICGGTPLTIRYPVTLMTLLQKLSHKFLYLILSLLLTHRIAKASGYKTSELETLEEGHTLFVGGKEVEVCLILFCSILIVNLTL
jgi:hypothetical protein